MNTENLEVNRAATFCPKCGCGTVYKMQWGDYMRRNCLQCKHTWLSPRRCNATVKFNADKFNKQAAGSLFGE